MSADHSNTDHESSPDQKSCCKASRYWYLIVILVAGLASFFYWWRYYAFTDQGFMPPQPIHFSHKMHAGKHKIPCEYCHFNAQKSRHAGVPPLSVCLGCHDPAKGAVHADKPEIKKLLSLAKSEVDTYYSSDEDGDHMDPGVRKSGGMIHWNRVHQLPDHVFFSHEWHVKAGVSCKTCHGPIDEMEVVRQHADLTMGWCIECHRSDNYVSYNSKRSGLHERYDPEDPSSFLVGTGNYDVLRHNIRPDRVVAFEERPTKASEKTGGKHTGHAHAEDGKEHLADHEVESEKLRGVFKESQDESLKNLEYFSEAQRARLEELLTTYPDLPRWRVADLPETHREFYGEMMHQNAPTQCSTCHQ